MNLPSFIARRITFQSKRTFSKLSVRIAILGIMLSLAVMILSLAVMRGFKEEIREKVRGFSGDVMVMKFDLNASLENSPVTASPESIRKIRALPAVAFIQPVANKPGIINANGEVEGVVLKGVDKTYNWDFMKKILVAGRVIDFTDSVEATKEILVSRYTAARLKLKVNDDFLMYFFRNNAPPRPRKFRIAGIYNLGVEEVDRMYVIGALPMVQRLNNWSPQQTGGYEVRIRDFDHLEEAAARVDDELGIDLKSNTIIESFPAIFQWLSLLDVNTEVILVLMIAVAVINMISALLIIILERTGMIGILKALGQTNWGIQKIFLYNAAYLIGYGLLLGNVLGIGLGLFQDRTHFFTLDQTSYYVNFIPVMLDFTDIMLLNLGTLAICLLVMLLPSTLVTRIAPVKAIAFK
ncbi:ABC transporter permease [Hufsiella ginkgonis]|uniref:FtsX-like permease family protein n=1 Tax=Hufsiella ginkgonis TaxID=2695274 RepID=A0A7K1XXM3_9SPHI|nr:ABC transporter permease [Hufsiella ginkgonis]MXV15587.1 FtsX-like permease family protein [Hufsiella ginkgonis]